MQEIIRLLKQKHKQIYATIVGETLYIWRPLGRREYREILESAEGEYDLEERICQAAVLWPPDLDFSRGLAGVPGALTPEIKEQSGYGSPERAYLALDTYRAQLQHFEYLAETAIAATFPQITFEQMENWTLDELMWHTVRAEWAIKHVHGRQVEFRPGTGEEEEEAQESPTKTEEAQMLREAGVDPIMTVDPKTLRPPFTSFPLIAGTQWNNEELMTLVRKQVSGLPGVPGDNSELDG